MPEPDWVARLRDPADRAAAGDFAAAWLPALVAALARLRLTTDAMLVEEAAGRAIFDFVQAPERFDPARGSLDHYLRMAAAADLRNAIVREGRHRPAARIPVELDRLAGNQGEDECPRVEDFPELAAVYAALPDPDRAVFDRMRAGERATAVYAGLLGLGHLPPAEQAAEVKRVKERILRRFQRAARPPGET